MIRTQNSYASYAKTHNLKNHIMIHTRPQPLSLYNTLVNSVYRANIAHEWNRAFGGNNTIYRCSYSNRSF